MSQWVVDSKTSLNESWANYSDSLCEMVQLIRWKESIRELFVYKAEMAGARKRSRKTEHDDTTL